MHLQPVFAQALFFGEKVSDRLFERGLCLPSGSNITQDELDSVVENIKKYISVPQYSV
jgi:dTDP-4-amino-4,6-dideoxygalactose transaminase